MPKKRTEFQKKAEKEVKKITETIVEKYKPEKIILFGSFAYGKPTRDSDVDLFIIKKTNKSRKERHFEVDRLLLDRTIPLDILIYTPKEVRERLNLGDFFIQEVNKQGEVVYEK